MCLCVCGGACLFLRVLLFGSLFISKISMVGTCNLMNL